MSEIAPEIEIEVRRFATLLRQAIRAAGLSVSEVERRLGAGPKALRRIFSGHVDLKLKHLLAILSILGISQEEFFALAARPTRSSGRLHQTTPADFLAAFRRVGYRGDAASMGPPLMDDVDPQSPEEFDRMVEDALNRILERRRRQDDGLAAPSTGRRGDPPEGGRSGSAEKEAG
jgi:transcriptional regulator with XRE-family HTH domain